MSQSLLIVEDEASIREPLVSYFETNKFRVKAAANAAQVTPHRKTQGVGVDPGKVGAVVGRLIDDIGV